MAIQFYPQPGTILICDFNGFIEPEIIKRRPVIVIGPRLRNRGNLVNVVPCSTTRPYDVCAYNHKLVFDPVMPAPYNAKEMWVKADMVYTVAFQRLFVPQLGKDPRTGARQYDLRVLEKPDLDAILACVLHGIGLGHLTDHL
ncbi:type II toxin-antitoxin system PemK/MazF family toxin [Xenophilus sp.]|uniref:type II toxin-antitoxin system PemK/MazF family toxin n=1 Tax=Xenophilus sp. TaxID=1873499 RepID=UPI0037DC5511